MRTAAYSLLPIGLLATVLTLVATASPALAFGPQETIHFNNGDTKTNCRLLEVVGSQFTYRCPGQGWTIFNRNHDTATRMLLAGPQDKLTLRNGEVLTGEVMFKDYEHYEIKTLDGLKQVRTRSVAAVELGLEPEAPAQSAPELPGAYQESPEPLGESGAVLPTESLLIAAGGLEDAGAAGQPMSPSAEDPDSATVTDPADTGDTVMQPPVDTPNPVEDAPSASEATVQASPSQATTKKMGRTPREAKPIRRLVTPMTSPWKIDKPYGGNDTLY